jgi:hypothetical protein
MFAKEVMKYGNMRQMYINNFNNLKEVCRNLLHRHIKILMSDLYEKLVEGNVSS